MLQFGDGNGWMNAAMTDRSKEMGNGYEEDQTEISNYMSQQIGISSSLLLMIYIYMFAETRMEGIDAP